jgi:hypothetical protein
MRAAEGIIVSHGRVKIAGRLRRSTWQRPDLPEQRDPVPVTPALDEQTFLVEAIDRDPADLDTPVACGHSDQRAFVGAAGGPPRDYRRALRVLVFDRDVQIRDRCAERLDEPARPSRPLVPVCAAAS